MFKIFIGIIGAAAALVAVFQLGKSMGTQDNPSSNSQPIVELIQGENDFLIAFSKKNIHESTCSQPENGSPLGDFLVGGVYSVKYNSSENKFYTKGLNQGKVGCPWEDFPDPRVGSDIADRKMMLWGSQFTFDKSGKVYKDGDLVGFIFFPPS